MPIISLFTSLSLSLSLSLSCFPLNFLVEPSFFSLPPFKNHLENKKESLQHSTVFISNPTASRVVEKKEKKKEKKRMKTKKKEKKDMKNAKKKERNDRGFL